MTNGAYLGVMLGALFGWPVIELAGPIHHPQALTALLMTVDYLALFAIAGAAIERAVR